MKRNLILLALLLAVMLAVASVMPWGLPDYEKMVPGTTELENGSVLVAENRWFTSRIYTLWEDNVTEIYEESRIRDGEESRIVRAVAVEGGAYFIRVLDDGADWELVKLENGKVEQLHRGVFENNETVTGLQIKEDSCWITGVGESKAIFVYEYTETDGVNLRLIIPAWWVREVVSAEYDGTVIRVTTAYDETCFVKPDGGLIYSPDAAEIPLPSVNPRGAGWFLCKRMVLVTTFVLWLTIAAVLLTTHAICRRSNKLANRLTAVGGAAMLLTLLATTGSVFCVVRFTAGLQSSWRAGQLTSLAALIIWLLTLVLLRSTAGHITRPVTALSQQMERVSDGDMTPQEPAAGTDELCQMDQSLQMMCMNLSVWKYESASTIRAYQRFVPEKMADLLERPVAEEIRLGDSRRMVGNVGMFAVGNRTEARNILEDAAFVDFINHSFSIFHDCVEENHGWMLSSGLRLSDMEALFPDSPADGVRAGLDFLGKLRVRRPKGVPEPRVCLILHKASFLYGIAGQEERLFPYLSSSELEFLGSFTHRFDEVGVRIVATEAYWKQLEGCGFTGRYIGFVSSKERGEAYKLYEVLDVYPELERDLRRCYDQRFQEAINLFYHNDFYLARNLFSSLLRACSNDGVARWYLFACERFFNEEGDVEPDYSLFGTME